MGSCLMVDRFSRPAVAMFWLRCSSWVEEVPYVSGLENVTTLLLWVGEQF